MKVLKRWYENDNLKKYMIDKYIPWLMYIYIHRTHRTYIEYIWKNTPVTSHGYWWLTSRKWIVTKWDKAASLLNLSHWTDFISFNARDCGSDFKSYPVFISRRFIYERSDTNIRDWSQAYSFIYIFLLNGATRGDVVLSFLCTKHHCS